MAILNKKIVEEAAWEYNPVKKLDCEFIRSGFVKGAHWAEEQMGDLAVEFALYYVKNRAQYIANEQETARRILFKQFLKERANEES